MNIIQVIPVKQEYLPATEVGKLIGRKKTATINWLKEFKGFVEENPNFFRGVVPIQEALGESTTYHYLCLACFKEYKDLLLAGSRSITFKKFIEGRKELGLL